MTIAMASNWLARGRLIPLNDKPLFMGIANLTPDSFSERPLFAKQSDMKDSCRPEEAFDIDDVALVGYALNLIHSGAAIIDLGAESTSPGSQPVPPEEQLRRLLPSVKRLARLTSCPISIDTTSSIVARQTLEVGAMIINDVSGGTFDPEMIDVVRHYQAGICLGHMQGKPRTMQVLPRYNNVVAEIREYLAGRRDEFMKQGVSSQAIALDPGIGFGKTQEHNLEILRHADEFRVADSVLMFGHSRKRFLRSFCGDSPSLEVLDALTAFVSAYLARKGVDVLRVHRIGPSRGAAAISMELT